MNRKILLFSLLGVVILAGAFLLYRYGLDWISADTAVTDNSGNADASEVAEENGPILTLDDGVAVVTENEAITMRIKVNFPAAEKYARETLNKTIGPTFYLVGKLGNALKASDNTEILKSDNFSKTINNLYGNGKTYSKFTTQEYTVTLNVPSGAFKDNQILNSLTLYSCTNASGSNCWQADSGQKSRWGMFGRTTTSRTKIADISHTTTIDYTQNVVDLSIDGRIAKDQLDFLIPGKTNQEETTFEIDYKNNSEVVATGNKIKFYMPKDTFLIEQVTDTSSGAISASRTTAAPAEPVLVPHTMETATIGEADTAKEYDVMVVDLGSLGKFATGGMKIKVKALQPDDMTGNTIINSFAEISTESVDNNAANNRIDLQVYFGIFTATRSN